MLDFLKKRRVSLTESQIGDAEYTYGSLSEFKRAIKGSRRNETAIPEPCIEVASDLSRTLSTKKETPESVSFIGRG